MTKVVPSDICSALDDRSLGSKVVDREGFMSALERALGAFDFSTQRIPGQALISLPEAVPFVSAGVGRRSSDPRDYVLREHRGKVGAYLRREHALPAESCSVVVYTHGAYLLDPDVTVAEAARVSAAGATHVLVAVLASAGPASPLSPYRFVWNLAGGNREAAVWSADEIRAKAREIIDYDNAYDPVADP